MVGIVTPNRLSMPVRRVAVWLHVVCCVRLVWRLHRLLPARPPHKAVAAPVELDVLLPELYQSSHLAAFRAQRAPHVRREVQELIPTDALGG